MVRSLTPAHWQTIMRSSATSFIADFETHYQVVSEKNHGGDREGVPARGTEGGRGRAAAWGMLLLASLTMAIAACQEERRVPYVAPKLSNWKQPYRGTKGLKLHVFRTGTLIRAAGLPLGEGLWKERKLPVLAYVLEHPREGLVVIGTGLNRNTRNRSDRRRPEILRRPISAELRPGEDLPSQMRQAGLRPEKVRWVLLPNLRFHHTGEVEAFPQARVVIAQAERERNERSKEYIEREIDMVENWKFVDFDEAQPLGTMRAALDLFGDGSCMLVDARGPTPGTVAFLIRLPTRPVILAGDFAPTEESLRYAAAPASLSNADAWWDHIWRLKRFVDLEPALLAVLGHEPDALRKASLPEVRWHEFAEPAESRKGRARATRTPK